MKNDAYGPSWWADATKMIDIVNPLPSFTDRQRKKIAEAYEYNLYWGLSVNDLADEFGVAPETIRRIAKKWFAANGQHCAKYTDKRY